MFYFLNHLTYTNIFTKSIVWFFAVPFAYIYVLILCIYILKSHPLFKEHPIRELGQTIRDFFVILVTAISAWGIACILKILFATPRPYLSRPDIFPMTLYGGMDSFPSGHATFFMALAVAVYRYHKKAGVLLFTGAFLIGAARVFGGIHFPIDVLAGWILGAGIGWALVSLIRRIP